MTVNRQIISKVYKWANIDQCDCLLCGLPESGPVSAVCQHCFDDLPWLPPQLCRCGLPAIPGQPCRDCLIRHLPVERIRPCLGYAFPVDRLLNHYKHHFDHACERVLELLWLTQPPPLPAAGALIPVPLHWYRLVRRGFNQSTRLAAALARHSRMPLMPILARQGAPTSQQGLGRRQRLDNLQDSFVCRRSLNGQHVVIVDDVVTTGATVAACARALKAAGAGRIDVWCLARTLNPQPPAAGARK